MRILHLLNDIRELGNGIINVAIDLACLQAKAGHEVAVASAGGEYKALLAQYGVHHYDLNQERRPLNLWRAVNRYCQIIQTFRPAIVHAHMMTGIVLARYGQTKHPYALVSTVHNEFQRSALLMGLADRVIAVSRAVAQSMIQRGIPEHKIRVVCNGTLNSPRDGFSAAESLPPVSLQRPAITTVAGMFQRKGIAELIAAFERVAVTAPDAHLYLVGNGPDLPKFVAQAQRTAVADRIHFEGFQPQPSRYLTATDIFVLASHREPFGLVLSEARAAKCAIVASRVDGIPEALDSGEAGLLVPPGHTEALANTISQLLNEPSLLNAWKMRSYQNLEWTQVSRMHQETLAVYQELKPIREKSLTAAAT